MLLFRLFNRAFLLMYKLYYLAPHLRRFFYIRKYIKEMFNSMCAVCVSRLFFSHIQYFIQIGSNLVITRVLKKCLIQQKPLKTDLKSNRGQPSVPVQVWPRANNNKQYSLSLRKAFLLLKFLCPFCVRLTDFEQNTKRMN